MNSVNLNADEILVKTPVKLSLVSNTVCRRKIDIDNVFDKPHFIKQLRFEQSRAQRSGSALSILLLTLEHTTREGSLGIRDLLTTAQTHLRETDILGYFDRQTLGVLLPYTNEEGAEKSRKKILDGFSGAKLTVTAATYPNQIFDSLAKKGSVSPDVLGFMLDDSIKHSEFGIQIKRAIDILGSIAIMLILSPVMLMTAIFVKLSSPGPVIFKQPRLGKKGVAFTFYKFRSMRTDSNDQIHREFVQELIKGNHSTINNGDVVKPLYKIKADPRVTRVGKFIRKTSIDELPQLFNVLKGDMSLVGPRPPLSYEAEKYEPWHLKRILDMKPGITGLWQVDGRSRTGFDDAVRLDVRYIQTWSILLDIKILFKTVKEVLYCSGAV